MSHFIEHFCIFIFVVETLAFLAESRPLGPFARCLLTYCKTAVVLVVVVVILWL